MAVSSIGRALVRKARSEPALGIGAVLVAVLNLYAAFGGELSLEQRDAVMDFALIASPFVFGAAVWIRQNVMPMIKARLLRADKPEL